MAAEKSRILIEVHGGIADWTADPSVQVRIIDYDNEAVGSMVACLPSSWRDLLPDLEDKYFEGSV